MTKYRLRFSKEGKIRFIGHLDLLKLYQRAIKRAKLPIVYSQGYNPHQLIFFATPLSLGVSSVGEYVELVFECYMKPEELKDKLNAVMPVGLRIIAVREMLTNEKNGASITEAGSYEIEFPEKPEFSKYIDEILAQKEIIIQKRRNKTVKSVNIRGDIYEMCNLEKSELCKLKVLISAGSTRSLKPEILAEYFYTLTDKPFEPYKIKYKRLDLLSRAESRFISLSEVPTL